MSPQSELNWGTLNLQFIRYLVLFLNPNVPKVMRERRPQLKELRWGTFLNRARFWYKLVKDQRLDKHFSTLFQFFKPTFESQIGSL